MLLRCLLTRSVVCAQIHRPVVHSKFLLCLPWPLRLLAPPMSGRPRSRPAVAWSCECGNGVRDDSLHACPNCRTARPRVLPVARSDSRSPSPEPRVPTVATHFAALTLNSQRRAPPPRAPLPGPGALSAQQTALLKKKQVPPSPAEREAEVQRVLDLHRRIKGAEAAAARTLDMHALQHDVDDFRKQDAEDARDIVGHAVVLKKQRLLVQTRLAILEAALMERGSFSFSMTEELKLTAAALSLPAMLAPAVLIQCWLPSVISEKSSTRNCWSS